MKINNTLYILYFPLFYLVYLESSSTFVFFIISLAIIILSIEFIAIIKRDFIYHDSIDDQRMDEASRNLAQKNVKEALKILESIQVHQLKYHPKSEYFLMKAFALKENTQNKDAQLNFELAIEHDNKRVKTWDYYIGFLRSLNAPFTSIATLNAYEETKNPYFLTQLGHYYLNQDKIDLAFEHLNKSSEINPYNQEAEYYKAIVYAKQGDRENMINSFRHMLIMNENIEESYKQAQKILEENTHGHESN